VINSNLPFIWHRLSVEFSLSIEGCLTLTLSLGVISCEYPDENYLPKTREIVLPPAANCTVVSSLVCTKHRNVPHRRTDKQTDRRTDGIPLANTASNADAL